MSRCARFTFVAAVAVLTGRAHAHFAMPVLAPVDRIIANVEAHLKEHPDDAQGYYTLGRAHYLAWILKSEQILEWGAYGAKKRLPHLPPDWMVNREQYLQRARWNEAERQVGAADAAVDPAYAKAVDERWQALQKQGWTPPTPDAKVLDAHAQQAVVHHRKAIELDMNNGLYHIGLASIMEQYATRAAEIGVHFNPLWDSRDMPTPEAMSRLWRLEALSEYRKSYESAIGQDRKRKHQPIEGLHGLVSYNAIEGYLRLADQLDAGDVDAPVVNRMRADKAKLDGLRMAAITPIVFAFEPVASLDDLLTLDRIVRFDLDGDGVAEQRPWVGPHTAPTRAGGMG